MRATFIDERGASFCTLAGRGAKSPISGLFARLNVCLGITAMRQESFSGFETVATPVKHLTTAELEAALGYLRAAPKNDGVVHLIVRRPRVDAREVLDEAQLDPVQGDRKSTRLNSSHIPLS